MLWIGVYLTGASFLLVSNGEAKIFIRLCALQLNLSKAYNNQINQLGQYFHYYCSLNYFQISRKGIAQSLFLLIQKQQMEYLDNRANNQIKNYGQWFQNKDLCEYQPPKTVLQNQCITPFFPNKEKDKFIDPNAKGFHFQKAKKPQLFLTSMSPGPGFYELSKQQSFSTIEDKQKQSMSRNKSNRFQNGLKQQSKLIEKANYHISIFQESKKHAQIKFGKAERVSYFQQAMLQGMHTPSPGQYQTKIVKSHSLASQDKSTLLKEVQNHQKKAKRSISIGPWSYQVKRSQSVACFAVMKNPYKQKDQDMKKRITDWNRRKQNMRSPDPGKYSKIQQWGKFNGPKQVSNGLRIISKPVLKIYN